MKILVINQSRQIPELAARRMVEACALQLARDVAPAWERLAPGVELATSPAPGDAAVVLSDQPRAALDLLGEHSEAADDPNGRIYVSSILANGGCLDRDPSNPRRLSVASVLSHELIELFIDSMANRYADGPQIAQGGSYALEACDPVEDESYVVTIGDGSRVQVSNFVLPRWFDPEATGPCDFLKSCVRPFSLTAGGYMIVRGKPGSEAQVLGASHPAWKRNLREASASSRWNRRVARGALTI